MEDDYLMDDEEVLDEDGYYDVPTGDDDSEDIEDDSGVTNEESSKEEDDLYNKLFTATELSYISKYDEIVAAGKSNREESIKDAFTLVVESNPFHTSAVTVSYVVMDSFDAQGHNRMRNTTFVPETQMTGRDADIDYSGEDDDGINEEFTTAMREQIARFVEYLSTRDLSKDSTASKKIKQRQLPAFIIYMFSSGFYNYIMDCPTMPPEYDKQIKFALEHLNSARYEVVEELATRYEQAGRPKVAERVRKMQTQWFEREPAEIRTAPDLSDLGITMEDVAIYREYRSKFTNISKSITQDVISDYIEVAVAGGTFQKLKDKTRSQAIEDVKRLYKAWADENPGDSDLAKKIIWKDV